ncbi:DUF4236 domain-containing protein [Texcoconibacillus texcoconensis]|uniref:DUF4236 domain-containing protein n=1 Tax=Texcoconibacillus texcoconensis TaxID=1095777 RepID=A0A840QNP9_9BACI|nr:DUF4236 domain-containing protein [Texcoconibacillus texcoconensis]MBB5173016.1 hypothetical protein [Texcoconibacillus texcoconensis]
MSFRFQKRVRVAPGVRLNFSKRGVSTSFGRRGASVSVGRRGVYGNVGVPGSGLSYRTKLNAPSRSKKHSSKTHKPKAGEGNIQVDWDDEKNDITFETETGKKLTEAEEKAVRKHYKEEMNAIYAEKAKEINRASDILRRLHHEPFLDEDIEEIATDSLTIDVEQPDLNDIHEEVEANERAKLNFFGRLKLLLPNERKSFSQQVNEKANDFFQKKQAEYEKEQTIINEEKKKRQTLAQAVKHGNVEAMEEWLEMWLPELDFPLETDVDFSIIDEQSIYADIDLPNPDAMPTKKARLLKSGKLKVENKTQRDRRDDYAKLVSGTAFYLASFFFSRLPTVQEAIVSGYRQKIEPSTGHEKDEYIYSLIIDRHTFRSLNLEYVDPIEAFSHFQPRMNATKTYIFKEIEPYDTPEP